MKKTPQQEMIFEKITKPLAGRTLFWTPFLRVQSESANRARKWGPDISWIHYHADWHLIGIRLQLFGGVYKVSWVSDPAYFFLKKGSRIL